MPARSGANSERGRRGLDLAADSGANAARSQRALRARRSFAPETGARYRGRDTDSRYLGMYHAMDAVRCTMYEGRADGNRERVGIWERKEGTRKWSDSGEDRTREGVERA